MSGPRPGAAAIEAVIFDGEGVVIDTETIWDEGQRVFLARYGLVYDRDRVKAQLTGRSLVDGVRALQQAYDLPGDPEALARERAEIVREKMEGVAFIPGFEPFFAEVRRQGLRTCLATAMDADLFAIVDARLGLRRLFDGRVCTLEDVDHRSKPDPALFLCAARRVGVAPAACLVIEDSPLGVEAAHRAGMRCIGLATTYAPPVLAAADRVVSRYDEIDVVRAAGGPPARSADRPD